MPVEDPEEKFIKFDEKWAEVDSPPESFDDLLFAEERLAWAKQRKCQHCYIWVHNKETDVFFVACAHGCGSIRHKWKTKNREEDMAKVKVTQEAYVISHAHGCPRDMSRTPKNMKKRTFHRPN